MRRREHRWRGHDDPLGGHDQIVGVHLDPCVALADRSHWLAEVDGVAECRGDAVGDGRRIAIDQVGLGERAVGVVLEPARGSRAATGEDQRTQDGQLGRVRAEQHTHRHLDQLASELRGHVAS